MSAFLLRRRCQMLSSFKLTQSVAYLLVCSLVVAGLIRSTTLPASAFGGAQPLQLASIPAESGAQAAPQTVAVDEATKARVSEAYNKLPLRFEENRGQVDKQVTYLSRGAASTLFLTKTEAVLTLHRGKSKEQAAKAETPSARRTTVPAQSQASPMSVVRMKLQGANRSPSITGEHEMSARTNYFIGNDPQQWQGDVAQYEGVRYAEVYPGIDLLYYGQQQSLEYDFEVEPGADPRRIVLGYKGVRGLKIESGTGDLLLETGSGEVRQGKPVVYQEVTGERREIEGRYVLKGKRRIGFKLGAYDQTKRLVIDPVLRYSTYLGGSGTDRGNGIAIDAVGNAYVTGDSTSDDFPVLNQYQTHQQVGEDAFVMKLNPNLSGAASLLYSTYLGGSGVEHGLAIAVRVAGNAYVTGSTLSTDFPVVNQYQTFQRGMGDAFVARLNTNLSGTASLIYSTYLGSSGADSGNAIATDISGNAYVTGDAGANNFPTRNQYQTFQGGQLGHDAFVTKINTNLSGAASLLYSTYLGGSGDDYGNAITIDAGGIAYVTGGTSSTNFPLLTQYQTDQGDVDAFVTRLNPNLSGTASLLYSTYLGGSNFDRGLGIAVDFTRIYVTGETRSNNFPTRNAYQPAYQGGTADAFVSELNLQFSDPSSLVYSTYLGGSGDDYGNAIALDITDNTCVTGSTSSTNFPLRNEYQTNQAFTDAFVTKLSPFRSGAASLLYSTYLGGSEFDFGYGIAVDAAGNVYVTGYTFSNNFPTRHPYQTFQGSSDVFVTKLTVTPPPGDFGADRRTDFALWHPTSGNWEYYDSSSGAPPVTRHWGASGDRPVPGYYDQDGQTDLAFFRPSEGNWYILQSFDNSVKTAHWGESTDLLVAADYDGDGKADIAVYRPSEGVWYIIQSSDNNVVAFRWGLSEDKPVPADYDRDGRADLAVYRPSESVWYILQSSDNSFRAVQWGLSGDKPVIGDFDGDEKADVTVVRLTTGTWYALRSSDGSLFAALGGGMDSLLVPGDYDGDRKTDAATWYPAAGMWFILRSSDGAGHSQQFGSSGDIPVPSTYWPQ
jgi:hypothetical protein